MPLFAEKLVISAAGMPRRRSRCQTRSGRPVRTVDFCILVRIARTAGSRPATNTHAATSSADDVDAEAGLLGVADDHAAENRTDDLAERRDRGQGAEPIDPRQRALRLGHDALRADGARHVPDAQCGRGKRDGRDALSDDERKRRRGGDRETEAEQDRGVVLLGPPAEADGQQHRRDGEARGGQAERGAVGAERQEPVGRHRPRERDRHLQQEDAGDGADEPPRRQGTFGRRGHDSPNPRPRPGREFASIRTSSHAPAWRRRPRHRPGRGT